MRMWSLVVLGWCLLAVPLQADDEASRMVLLVNEADPDSRKVAEYYAERRGVPLENIISLEMPVEETITWREFVLTIWQPLQDELMEREWIDGIAMNLRDDFGRRKVVFSGHRISYLVVCRGVPLRVKNDPALYRPVKALPERGELRTNRAAVDSELCLIAAGNYNINAFLPNPLYNKKEPPELLKENVVKVSRLDGPTVADVLGMIDGAIEAERDGLIGRAYVDIKGPYAHGERWLKQTAELFDSLGVPMTERSEKGTFALGSRFDAPVLYAGWYTGNVNGPFRMPGFRFATGAIAVHIHSYSASTLRSDNRSWCGPLIARGVAATCGAVYEPYLDFMHRPNMLFKGLSEGMSLGEAAFYSVMVLSWQNVLVGDPMYRPFKKSFEEQWSQLEATSPRKRPYLVLREMKRLEKAGLADDAISLARSEQRDHPSLPVGAALAELLAGNDDASGAAQAVGFARYLKRIDSGNWGLLTSVVPYLMAGDEAESGVEVYRNLLAQQQVPKALRKAWLEEGSRVAHAAGNLQQAMDWDREKNRLNAEAKK